MSTSTQPSTTTEADPAAVIRSIYAGFENRDVEGVMARFDDEIEISQSPALPWGGVHHGIDGALGFFGTLSSHIDTNVEIDRMIVAGDEVVEVGRTCGRAIATGRRFEIDEVHVWRLRDGKVIRMHAIVDDAAMLTALGVLPKDVVNTADRWPVSKGAVGPSPVVVAKEGCQGLRALDR